MLKLEVHCPNCGDHKRTHDLSAAPQIKARMALVKRQKADRLTRQAREQGLKVRRVDPEAFDVAREDLGPDADAWLRGWGKRQSETVYCVCGGVLQYEHDPEHPLGIRVADKTPPERRRKAVTHGER